MIITTPALAVAFRLTTLLPVRRHEWQPRAPDSAKIDCDQRDALERREKVRALLAKGMSQRDIATHLQVSRTTVYNHVHAIKAEERARELKDAQ